MIERQALHHLSHPLDLNCSLDLREWKARPTDVGQQINIHLE